MFGRKRIAELQRQVSVMRSALLWYATEENWRRKGIHPKGARKKWRKSSAAFDRGAVASRALAVVDGSMAPPESPRAPAFPPRDDFKHVVAEREEVAATSVPAESAEEASQQ